jgi:signal transduction histidine kinase
MLLSIGDDLDRAESVRLAVLTAIFWVGGAALLFALAFGFFAARRGQRRMDALSATMRRVSGGDLSARAPARVGGDDIDAIGRGVNEMLAQIDLLVANVRRVSTDIAHDMRTPLTHVRQELEAAAASDTVGDAHERIRRAQAKIDDVLRIFSAMLRLAEIESGSVRVRFAGVDLAAVLERVIDAYRPDVEAAGRTLVADEIASATVQGDADLMAQAVSNLIENAMRHTPAGTAITVRLKRADDRIVLQVEDRGPGIPEAERDRVLKPFERLENSRSSPGAGLGLSIVNAIARLHHARLMLEDARPGLRVVLEWPG